ncbi:MAG: hypothetical protein LWX55_05925 [Deltaproteobacteria bacterium]|jgi:hypothetical protein|nr:hypothetical protein [Deltaproteobacteria bacterium]
MVSFPNTLSKIMSALKVLFVERRLPCRVEKFIQDKLYKTRTERAIAQVLTTKPVFSGKKIKAEIRVLTNDSNVNMTILALKSFLRFFNEVNVFIHDDGTVTNESKEKITKHIIGSKVISLGEADNLIKNNRKLWKLRQEAFAYFQFMPITVHKLFDLYTLSAENKLIMMDSDILFLQEPTEVLEWIRNDENINLYARPYLRNLVIDDSVLEEKFGHLDVIKKFNSGLLCMRKDLVKFDYVIEALNKLKGDERTPILGDECIWRFAFSMTESKELPFERYPLFSEVKYFRRFIKKHPNIGYVHFLLKHTGGFYRKYASIVVDRLSF